MEWLGWIVAALLSGVVSWLLSVNKKLQEQVAEQTRQAEALDTARRKALADRDATVRRVRQSAEERVLQSDGKGFVRLKGIPEEGFDIVGIADGSGLEVDNVRASKVMPPPEDADPPPESDG